MAFGKYRQIGDTVIRGGRKRATYEARCAIPDCPKRYVVESCKDQMADRLHSIGWKLDRPGSSGSLWFCPDHQEGNCR